MSTEKASAFRKKVFNSKFKPRILENSNVNKQWSIVYAFGACITRRWKTATKKSSNEQQKKQ
jgi:hypothetical protein